MHARSALFDLYGDHLRSRGDCAPVAALVQVLAPLEINAPAVRTAISRMVRQGWLAPVRLPSGRGYALTPRARRRLDEAGARIYRTRHARWRGSWDLLVIDAIPQRSARGRVRTALAFLGYAPLTDSTWISPFPSTEVETLLSTEGIRAARFEARDDDPAQRAARAWDLTALASAYASWREDAQKLVDAPESVLPSLDLGDEEQRAFVVRSHLVHEWRKFLFTDPGLPAELLPADWPGDEAASFFAAEAARLLPAASRYVDRCLSQDDLGVTETAAKIR